MADNCPDCGADATVSVDGSIFCAGPSKVTREQVADAERKLKFALANGLPYEDLDKTWRILAAQASCGKVM